jgi:hypothetical protein
VVEHEEEVSGVVEDEVSGDVSEGDGDESELEEVSGVVEDEVSGDVSEGDGDESESGEEEKEEEVEDEEEEKVLGEVVHQIKKTTGAGAGAGATPAHVVVKPKK